MKTYQKPQITTQCLLNNSSIAAGLSDWMQSADVGLESSNITTYEMVS